MATYSSILTWRIPWTEEPGWLQSVGSQRVQHNCSDLALRYQPYLSKTCLHCLFPSDTQASGFSACPWKWDRGDTEWGGDPLFYCVPFFKDFIYFSPVAACRLSRVVVTELLFIVVRGLLTAVVSLVAEHELHAWADRLLSTGPAGKFCFLFF